MKHHVFIRFFLASSKRNHHHPIINSEQSSNHPIISNHHHHVLLWYINHQQQVKSIDSEPAQFRNMTLVDIGGKFSYTSQTCLVRFFWAVESPTITIWGDELVAIICPNPLSSIISQHLFPLETQTKINYRENLGKYNFLGNWIAGFGGKVDGN